MYLFRTAAGLVLIICQSSEMLQFYFTLLSSPRLLTCLFLFLQVFCANCMLVMASILHLGKSGLPKKVCALEMARGPATLCSDLVPKNEALYPMLLLFFCRLLRMMMWIASHSVYVLWQSVFLS